jgi:hypothetical protein
MKLLLPLAILAITMLFLAQSANAALTERTVTVKIAKEDSVFKIRTYDFERKISIDVNDDLLKKIVKAFGTNTFHFYNKVSKKQSGDASITIAPKIQVGQRLQVKFI